MIDSHTHLHVCKPDDAELVAAAVRAGVTRMLTVGTTGATCRAALQAAERYPQVFAAIGRHPNEATGFDEGHLAELRALAEHPRCVAIVSSSAARVWMTSGLPVERASSIWASNARRWSPGAA